MASMTTPSGQVIEVPDWLAGQLGPPTDGLGLGPSPTPIVAPMGEIPAGGVPEPRGALPAIGANGMVPNPYEQPAPAMAPPVEFKGTPVGAPPPGVGELVDPFPAPTPAQKKQEAAAAKQGAARQAFASTPEGRIAASEQGALETVGQQQAIAAASGDVAAREADDIAALKAGSIENQERIAEESRAQDAERQVQIAEATKAREDAVNAEAKYKIDDTRRWSNLSTGRKVLAGISVALSGLGDALMRKTGPNMALSIITGAIKDDVDAQVREREQLGKQIGIKQNSLDNYRKMAADDVEAGQLKMAEEYKRAAMQVDATASRYGSDKAKLAAAQLSAELNGKASEIIGRYGEAAYNRDIKAKEMAMQRQQIGISGGHLALAGKQFEYQKKRDQDMMLIEVAKLNKAGDAKQAEEYLKRGIGGTAEPVTDKDGNVTSIRQVPLKNRDGSLFIPTGSEASIDKLRNEKVATDRLVQIMDQVMASGPEWLTDRANSDKLQEMKADWAAAKLEVKDVKQLGVIAGPDLDLIEDFLGTPDPTRWKDSKAGITRSRSNLVRGMNTRMQAHGFDGEYAPKALSGLGKDPAETEYKNLLTNSAGSDLGDRSITGMLTNLGPAGAAKRQVSIAEGAAQRPEMQKQIDALSMMARSGNNQARELGYSRLVTLAAEAKSPVIQKLAADAIANLQSNDSFPTETPR